MICSKCGKENAEGNWTCAACGEPLAGGQPQGPPAGAGAEGYGGAFQGAPGGYSAYDSLPSEEPRAAGSDRQGHSGGLGIVAILMAVVVIAAIPAWYFISHRGQIDTSTPSGAMHAYVNALNDKDCEAIIDMTAGVTAKPTDQEMTACSSLLGMFDYSLSDYSVISENQDASGATVEFEVTLHAGNLSDTQRMSAEMVQENGQWKLSGMSLPDSASPGTSFPTI